MSLDDLYKETILDHYQRPRNRGQLEDPDVATRGHNPLCGDEVLLAVKMDGDVIQDIAFGGRGCSIGQASASMMTEAVKGHHLSEATALSASLAKHSSHVVLSRGLARSCILALSLRSGSLVTFDAL